MRKEEVYALEQKLSFSSFTNEDAYVLAKYLLQRIQNEHKKDIGIRIVLHNTLVYQYLMKDKKDDIWLIKKQNTVEHYRHSSYYIYLENIETLEYEGLKKYSYAICGGGFPIYVNKLYIGCVCISGLPHEEDHNFLVTTLEAYWKEKQL